MTLRTINVAIALAQIFEGAPVAGARVRLELTGPDVDGSTLILPKSASVVVDENGENSAEWWANADGSQGTQTKVTVYDADGKLQFEGLATFPAYDCTLVEALQLVPDESVTDAQRWALKARDWAISPTDVEPGLPSAKTSAVQALADRLLADQDVQLTHQDVQLTHTDTGKTAGDVVTTSATKAYLDSLYANFLATLTPALAIMLGYAGTATAAVGAAQTAALQALSVAQQDLSGVSGAAMHRTNGTVLGTFPIDTTKDSDPTWMDRMAGASWYQEAATSGVGAWVDPTHYGPGGVGIVGSMSAELNARLYKATLGGVDGLAGTFASAVGWTTAGAVSFAGGAVTLGAAASAYRPIFGGARNGLFRYTVNVTLPSGSATVSANNGADSITFTKSGVYSFYLADGGGSGGGYAFFTATAGATVSASVYQVTAFTTSSGAYYNSAADGKQYRLCKNVIGNSSALDQAPWAYVNASITPNATTDHNGAMLADKLVEGNANNVHYAKVTAAGLSPSYAVMTFSCYAKAAERTKFALTNLANWFNVNVDLTAGTAVATAGTASIVNLGGGIYRISATSSGPITTAHTPNIALQDAAGNTVYQGDGVSGLYVWGVQLEYGAAMTALEDKTTGDLGVTEVFRSGKAKLRKGVGVYEAGRVTIYDLDEPGRPMWMVILAGAGTKLGWNIGAAGISSASYKDGWITVGTSNSNGAVVFDLSRDDTRLAATGLSFANRTIATRNTSGATVGGGGYIIGSLIVNSVAVATMRDAPVDPMTGLAIPTVALGLQGGSSTLTLLKPDGSVVGASYTTAIGSVLMDRHAVYGQIGGSTTYVYASNPSALVAGFAPVNLTAAVAPSFGTPGVNNTGHALTKRGEFHVRSNTAMVASIKLNELNPAASLTRRITDVSNSGWMVGDERGAWLSDTSSGVVDGTELVARPTFADATGWTFGTTGAAAAASIAGNQLLVPRVDGVNFSYGYTTINTVVGQTYTILISSGAVGLIVRFGTAALDATYGNLQPSGNTTAVPFTFKATAPTFTITVFANSNAATGICTLCSAAGRVLDVSPKANRLDVVGTVQKTPVASLAQLVAYYGFSAANYLRQAYSVSLDFATGGFALLPWVSVTNGNPEANLLSSPEDFTTASWNRQGVTVTATGVADPFGGTAAARITANSANAELYQSFATTGFDTATTQYTGSYYLRRVSGVGTVRLYNPDGTTFTDITATLSGAWQRFTGTSFRGPSNSIYPGVYIVTAGDVLEVAFPKLNQGATAGTYVPGKTAPYHPIAPVFERSAAAGARITLGVDGYGRFAGEVSDGVNPVRAVTSTTGYGGAGWVLPELSLSTSGALTLKVNGAQVAQTVGAPLASLNNAAAVLTVGNRYDGLAPFPGSIALVRVGATIPTDDQSRFVYDQEKAMFQPGAQVTLADSGAVVALTGDVQQNLLIAGSAANESTFSGCVRVASAPAAAGSIANITSVGGVKCVGRTGTNAGVDVTIPARNLREDLDYATRTAANDGLAMFEYGGGFQTGGSTGNSFTLFGGTLSAYPSDATLVGAQVTGTAAPLSATILGAVGTGTGTTSVIMSANGVGGVVAFAFNDFIMPRGWEPRAVFVTVAGATKRCREGSSLDYVVWFDGFRYRVRFVTAPGATAVVQIDARQFEMRKAA